jgi:hypothetical protein
LFVDKVRVDSVNSGKLLELANFRMNEPFPLRDKVQTWLESQGYPLEMRAASIFRAAGFQVVQSESYVDQESGKLREVDFVCSHDDEVGFVSTKIVVECKSGDKPWIVFSSPHVLENYNRYFAYAILSSDMKSALLKCEYDLIRRKLSWVEKPRRTGYSVVQAFKQNEDEAYGVSQALVKAARAQLPIAEPAVHPKQQFATVFPVLVIDSPLFECYLGDKGSVQLAEVSEAEFFVRGDGPCVRIVTFPALPLFSRAAWTETHSLLELLKPAVAKAIDRLKNPGRRVLKDVR